MTSVSQCPSSAFCTACSCSASAELTHPLVSPHIACLFLAPPPDFTHMRDYLRRTLSGQLPLFSLRADSAMGQLLGKGVPRIAESQVDSKKVGGPELRLEAPSRGVEWRSGAACVHCCFRTCCLARS